MNRLLLTLFIAFLLYGCATPYQSAGWLGGFSETRLDENVFQVNFMGNEHTSFERANDFTLLRCAELTINNGYQYFLIVDTKQHVNNKAYTSPVETKTEVTVKDNKTIRTTTTSGGETKNITSEPSNSNTIVCFKEKPDGFSYNAKYIISSLKEKYDL